MVHELATYRPDHITQVLKWPLREALLCYLNQLKTDALDSWRHETLCYSVSAPHLKDPGKPPKRPRILSPRADDGEE